MNYIIFQIACFQFHADFEQISQKMDIKIAYMARGNSALIFAKITSLRFASGESIFHSTGGGIWYEKILPKKISPLFWWTYFETIHWLSQLPLSLIQKKKKNHQKAQNMILFSLIRSKSLSAIFKCVTPCCGDDWSTFRHFFTNKPWIYYSEWSSIINIEKTSWLVIK